MRVRRLAWVLVLGAVGVSGCTVHRSIVATRAQTQLVGMSKVELLSCAGAPVRQERAEEFEFLIADRDKVLLWIKEYSPIELASKDDPPIYLDYPNQKTPPMPGNEEPDPTHSAIYGIMMAERFRPMGVEVVVSYPGHQDERYGSLSNFLIKKLSTK